MNVEEVAATEGAVFSDQYVVLQQICGDPEFYVSVYRNNYGKRS
jgi:hypothetical protein